MKKLMQRFKNERGLTLVELLAVIVILAIIAVIAFVMIGKVIDNSKKDAHIANAQQLISSAKLYDSQGDFSGTTVNSEELQKAGLIDELINPWKSNDSTYKGTVTKTDGENGVKYTVKLSGADVKCNLNKEGLDEKALSGDRDDVCQN